MASVPSDLSGEQASLLLSVTYSPIASVISNPRLPDNPIVVANAAFYALTGYGPEDVLGPAPPPSRG